MGMLKPLTSEPQRYLSMLCAALAIADREIDGAGFSARRQREQRLHSINSYERAWALACRLASHVPHVGETATDGLRGIRSVNRRLIC